ncbi:MAG: MFS transporter [Candidatus Odinarchaeota archaeon]
MILKPLISFLGANKLPLRAQSMLQKAVITIVFIELFFGLSSTFYVLFVIDSVGYELLGVLLFVSFILQAVLDYPSGTIGDWIGQKWLLFVAYLSFGLAYLLLFVADSFETLLLVYCIQAFASSQASGAIDTWIDNNYKIAVGKEDPDREVYRLFWGKYGMISQFISGMAFLTGGFLSTVVNRQFVFIIQSAGLFILAVAFLFIIRDFPEVERVAEKSLKNYLNLLVGGLSAVFMNRVLLLLILGICIRDITWVIWSNMILFPLYFSYTGSDAGASIFRFILFIAGIPIIGLAAKIASKLDVKWMPRMLTVHTLLFFGGFIIITELFPLGQNTFELMALVLCFIVFVSTPIFFHIPNILQQKIMLDAIPDKNRNAVYSLIPTMLLLVNAPATFSGGTIIGGLGLTLTLIAIGVISLVGTGLAYLAIKSLPKSTEDAIEAKRQESAAASV